MRRKHQEKEKVKKESKDQKEKGKAKQPRRKRQRKEQTKEEKQKERVSKDQLERAGALNGLVRAGTPLGQKELAREQKEARKAQKEERAKVKVDKASKVTATDAANGDTKWHNVGPTTTTVVKERTRLTSTGARTTMTMRTTPPSPR